MKYILIIPLWVMFAFTSVLAQENANLKNGYAAQGYDVVSYFQNRSVKGKAQYQHTFEGIKYKFYDEENLSTFQQKPKKYIPQYSGFCAYAIAKNSKKVSVNPKTYTISEGKLYLFYNSWGINTLIKWNDEGPEMLRKQADSNWQILLKSK